MQTRKVTRFPVVLSARDYWGGLHRLDPRHASLPAGKISAADLDLIQV